MDDKQALMESSLERAAEIVGDLTGPVMERYYAAFPQARQMFEEHGCGSRERLEISMVETVLYCAMYWIERPAEIEILLGSSVPHHQETLHIDLQSYCGLVDALVDVIAQTIPAEATDERALWAEIRRALIEQIKQSRSQYVDA